MRQDKENSSKPFAWLHLSDFHFRAEQRWRERLPLEALLNTIQNTRGAAR